MGSREMVFDIDAAAAALAAEFGMSFSDEDECYPCDYWRETVRRVLAAATGLVKCTQPDQHDGECTPQWTEIFAVPENGEGT